MTCTVSNAAPGAVSGWGFSDGAGGNVSASGGSTSWSGTMAVSGTVTVTISGYGTLSQGVTVTARSEWQSQPATPDQVPDGTLIWNGATATPLPSPPAAGKPLGHYVLSVGTSFLDSQIPSGPNQGYWYVTSTAHPSSVFYFKWEMAADLTNAQSDFAVHQCGTQGFISLSDLVAGTTRHEAGQTAQSHWVNYRNSLTSSAKDPSVWAEGRTAIPSVTEMTFEQNLSTGLSDLASEIGSDSETPEPYDVNYDIGGNILGYINYAPYASCN